MGGYQPPGLLRDNRLPQLGDLGNPTRPGRPATERGLMRTDLFPNTRTGGITAPGRLGPRLPSRGYPMQNMAGNEAYGVASAQKLGGYGQPRPTRATPLPVSPPVPQPIGGPLPSERRSPYNSRPPTF